MNLVMNNHHPNLGPVLLDPSPMGIIGESLGKPSIYFSATDTPYLAPRLGHVVVGKFPLSIPTSQHIQNAFANMNFVGCSWKYLDDRHVLIELSDFTDYVNLLNGPNGIPVWFIEQHPMRVFEWTTEFDLSFESRNVAVWCSLFALPLRFFDTATLFAIGRIFGNPIKIDHATITRSRISFARMCVEIDISKPPPKKFVLDIGGREITRRVKWDKIPLFCMDCRNVGHSKVTCCKTFRKKRKRPIPLFRMDCRNVGHLKETCCKVFRRKRKRPKRDYNRAVQMPTDQTTRRKPTRSAFTGATDLGIGIQCETLHGNEEDDFMLPNPLRPRIMRSLLVQWQPPDHPWVKLNTDGSFAAGSGQAGGGGLVRDSDGMLLGAFCTPLAATSGFEAELLALCQGLLMAKEQGDHVWIELDAAAIVTMLKSGKQGPTALRHTIVQIRLLLRQIQYKITHIPREGNRAADFLASRGTQTSDLTVYDHISAPPILKALVRMDQWGYPNLRFKFEDGLLNYSN
ncbi:uncharacterized protein LOC121741533 isoform X2 [Salvia splendens]|uniref:uncharacterized protein LOC121741533 isoform X2 n=1 Tax=Salvia splendens TaxID=180675 RepID=UPI001C27B623|nr:uncharacterized protein LOC121741533 isoform X2 [Salvia splendens]XP_041990272.1 uncharacterized protein LOC121741533 isoform X2 [Salvia splendens]XP_041990273.1 uncharacterized protein LOC121741533 isoform X2 [Salvia splendens]XP_041990274.1 uncharacterized protein LOC121741533 isoform X2 [Salvia splendens]XP_041990275.1 uncharacterized protein LOC121741533 isoform X2 [Salvia splendens]XP_041990276.1 uncharacterized protein LOC121741533 isoform X2 [Salvia splendens]